MRLAISSVAFFIRFIRHLPKFAALSRFISTSFFLFSIFQIETIAPRLKFQNDFSKIKSNQCANIFLMYDYK